jgi:hypothetical protein
MTGTARVLRLGPLLLPVLLGCGSRATVSGTVTYEGAAVEDGYISFFPADGPAGAQGAEVKKGHYEIRGLTPGKKRVLIATRPEVQSVPGAFDQRVPIVVPGPRDVPEKAVGNNQVHEISGGTQTLDLHLKKPGR